MPDPIEVFDYANRGEVWIVADGASLARVAADAFARVTAAAAAARGRAFVALSGGSTPKHMGELLMTPAYHDRVPWDRLEIFWGDERWVPRDHPESNAGVARRTFLDHVPVPASQVHPYPTIGLEPEDAATKYTSTLRTVFGEPAGIPRFDLILLGMGDDGHTASLFPDTAAIHERDEIVIAHHVPKLNATRLTFTPPLLNAGREVLFLVSGAGKAATLAAVLDGPERVDTLPSQVVRPTNGHLLWLVDEAAATQLSPPSGTNG